MTKRGNRRLGWWAAVCLTGLMVLGCASTRHKLNDPTVQSLRVPRGAAVRVTCKDMTANENRVQIINAGTKEVLGEVSQAQPQVVIPPAANKVAYRMDFVPLVLDPEQPKEKAQWLPAHIKIASKQGNKTILAVEDGYDNSDLQPPYAPAVQASDNYGDLILTVEFFRPEDLEPTTQRADLP